MAEEILAACENQHVKRCRVALPQELIVDDVIELSYGAAQIAPISSAAGTLIYHSISPAARAAAMAVNDRVLHWVRTNLPQENSLRDSRFHRGGRPNNHPQASAIAFGCGFKYNRDCWAPRPIPPLLDHLRSIAHATTGIEYNVVLLKVRSYVIYTVPIPNPGTIPCIFRLSV